VRSPHCIFSEEDGRKNIGNRGRAKNAKREGKVGKQFREFPMMFEKNRRYDLGLLKGKKLAYKVRKVWKLVGGKGRTKGGEASRKDKETRVLNKNLGR